MEKIRRIRKARKVYGISKGDTFLTLLYSYCIKAGEIGDKDHGRALSEYRRVFNQYILKKYGRQFYDEYCMFHMRNIDNKKLIKALNKKQKYYLDTEILGLLPDRNASAQKQKGSKKSQNDRADGSKTVLAKMHTARPAGVEKKETAATTVQASTRYVQPSPYIDYTPGRIYDTLPARNIDYIPPSFSKRCFKITMKRLIDDSEFVVYHQGKDANEAMMLANRHSFDSARIIKVEEEGKV